MNIAKAMLAHELQKQFQAVKMMHNDRHVPFKFDAYAKLNDKIRAEWDTLYGSQQGPEQATTDQGPAKKKRKTPVPTMPMAFGYGAGMVSSLHFTPCPWYPPRCLSSSLPFPLSLMRDVVMLDLSKNSRGFGRCPSVKHQRALCVGAAPHRHARGGGARRHPPPRAAARRVAHLRGVVGARDAGLLEWHAVLSTGELPPCDCVVGATGAGVDLRLASLCGGICVCECARVCLQGWGSLRTGRRRLRSLGQ